MGDLKVGTTANYLLHQPTNGVYIFVLEGEIEVTGEKLSKRDALGVWDTDQFKVTASANAKVLLMEVPMELS